MFKVVLTLSFVSLKKVKDVFGYFVHFLKLPWYSTINFNLNFMLGGGGWGGGGVTNLKPYLDLQSNSNETLLYL